MRRSWSIFLLYRPVSTAHAHSSCFCFFFPPSTLIVWLQRMRRRSISLSASFKGKGAGRVGGARPRGGQVGGGLSRTTSQRRAGQRPLRPRPSSCQLLRSWEKREGGTWAQPISCGRAKRREKSGTSRKPRWRQGPGQESGRKEERASR